MKVKSNNANGFRFMKAPITFKLLFSDIDILINNPKGFNSIFT